MKDRLIVWQALLVVIGLWLVTACREQTPVPTPTPTTAPTVAGLITPGPGTATPACQVTPPEGWGVYEVQRGDTLLDLAAGRGVTIEQVRRVNCLTSNVLVAGSSLYLPLLPTPTPCRIETLAGWALYRVQKGDTLFSLAAGRQTTVTEIERVNCLAAGTILAIDQELYLPELPTPTPTFTPTFTPIPPPPTATPLPRPTPTFPLVTPTPGIVSLSTAPLAQSPGQQPGDGVNSLDTTDNQGGAPNPTPGAPGSQPDPPETPRSGGNNKDNPSPSPPVAPADQPGPRVTRRAPSTLLNLPPLIDFVDFTYTNLDAEPSICPPEQPFPAISTNANRVGLCLYGMPLNQLITITFSSLDQQIDLSGSFQVEDGKIIWESEPGKGTIIGYTEKNDFSTPVRFDLPPGMWSLSVSYLANTPFEKVSFDNSKIPVEGLWVGLDRLNPGGGCILLSPEEAENPIKVAGTLPFDANARISLGVYGMHTQTSDLAEGYKTTYTARLITSTIVETTRSVLSTTLRINPSDILTNNISIYEYYQVVAAINPHVKGQRVTEMGPTACFRFPEYLEAPAPPANEEVVPGGREPAGDQETVDEATRPIPVPTGTVAPEPPTGDGCINLLMILGVLGGVLVFTRQRRV